MDSFLSPQTKSVLGRLTVEFSRPHTIGQAHTPGRSPLKERSVRRRGRYIYNTRKTQQTNTNTLSGIRTRRPNKQVAAGPSLRPHGHGQLISPILVLPMISLRTNGAAVTIHHRVFVRACRYEITTNIPSPYQQ